MTGPPPEPPSETLSGDPFDLHRFVAAQAPIWDDATAELQAGRKTSHWMWFVFPQLRGLGRSPTARFFGLAGAAEAEAYLTHPLLGARLVAATDLLLAHRDRSLTDILGPPDDMKARSCWTLFGRAVHRVSDTAPGAAMARLAPAALAVFCAGEEDPLTLELLAGEVSKPDRRSP